MGVALKSRSDTSTGSLHVEPSDAELIQRTLAGDRDAFGSIVQRYQERAYWAAVHLLSDSEEARDVSQEAFLRAYKALARFDFGMSFYTWLYRIVVNLSIDQLRRRSRFRAVPLDDVNQGQGLPDPDDSLRPSRRLEQGDDARRVRQVLDRLPEKYRTAMILRDLEGLPCKEIASIVHSTHSTVRWRLHVARKMFRAQWERMESAPKESQK